MATDRGPRTASASSSTPIAGEKLETHGLNPTLSVQFLTPRGVTPDWG